MDFMPEKRKFEPQGEILAKFQEILKAADGVEQYLMSLVKGSKADSATISRIKEKLVKRGQQLLLALQEKSSSTEEIKKSLENIKASILLFGSVLRELHEQGERFELKDFTDAEFIIEEGVINPDDIKQMRKIYSRNYAGTPEFQKELLDNFDRVMAAFSGYEDGDNTYYILKIGGKVVSFCRFKDTFDDLDGFSYKDFGFFNVDPDYFGLKIGEVMMEQSLDKEAQYYVLEATCTATEAIAERYIQRGFVGVHFVPDYKGIADLSIERDDERNKKYLSKKIEENRVVDMLRSQQQMNPSSEGDFKIGDTDIKIIAFHKGEKLPFSLTNEGWILTQYFTRDNVKYTVFEKIKEEEEIQDFELKDVA